MNKETLPIGWEFHLIGTSGRLESSVEIDPSEAAKESGKARGAPTPLGPG